MAFVLSPQRVGMYEWYGKGSRDKGPAVLKKQPVHRAWEGMNWVWGWGALKQE